MQIDRRSFLGTAAASAVASPAIARGIGPIDAEWTSLTAAYRVPDWFRDAKFGIWSHWGPQCQPALGDWYARLMYMQAKPEWMRGESPYEHHLKHYGHPSRTGFLDIIGQWRAEAWHPEYLLRRYREAGARYVMAMGCHHDNLDLFASKHHEWNSVRVGPKRDIVGTWAPLVRDAGLKFGVSNHSGHAWHWYQVAYGYDAEGPMRGRRYDAYWLRKHHGTDKFWEGLDPQDLYTGPYYVPPKGLDTAAALSAWHDKRDGQWLEGAPAGNQRFVEKWLRRQKQMVEDYRPDIIYLDHAGVPFGKAGLEAIAHYYAKSVEWHGDLEVVITAGVLGAFEQKALMWNVERGYVDNIRDTPWQTATCIGQWHYSQPVYDQDAYKSAEQVIQRLVDVVSKNGNLLLNIPVRGDGTIDDKEEAILDRIAAWTTRNGEAIFGSRPWRTFGEGPTKPPSGAMSEDKVKPFTSADLRFTSKGNELYVLFLDWPSSEAAITSLGRRGSPGAVVEQVELLGGGPVQFRQDVDALRVTIPRPGKHDFIPVLRMRGRGLN